MVGQKQLDAFANSTVDVEGQRPDDPQSEIEKKTKWRDMATACMMKVKSAIGKFLCGDWMFLALLGIVMALCSFGMDYCIEKIQAMHKWLFNAANTVGVQYLAWVMFTMVLVLFSSGFCHMVAPQAVGSGIPEMKTILRGVVLPEYLTFRTLISKVVGLTLCLGSGFPIGKEGPFVHVSSIVSTLLSKLITGFRPIYENETRRTEMLAAACAVGVACTFGAPIGGVLFSIEVTSVYFAVRNYWRAFFAATCTSIVFRLASVWFGGEETIVPFNKTWFSTEFPFDSRELLFYSLVGVACGLGGPLFVYLHRRIFLFTRNHEILKTLFVQNPFVYPATVAFFICSLTFPPGYGQFIVGMMGTQAAISDLFANFSWADPTIDIIQAQVVERWSPQGVSFFVTLTLFTLYYFCATALASTVQVPSGVFIPVFIIGASFGRLVGEFLRLYVDGAVVPGSYAVVGAAAFSGSVTHTISTAMIVFELTGQIVYMVPVMIAVLIANAIASHLQPSFYGSMMRMKKLPYLPDILPTSSTVHDTFVSDFMVTDIKCISLSSSYQELQDLLIAMPRLKTFPLVDAPASLVLLGSIPRSQLEAELERHVGENARREEAKRRRTKVSQELHLAEQELLKSVLGSGQTNTENTEERKRSDGRSVPGRFSVTPVDPNSLQAHQSPSRPATVAERRFRGRLPRLSRLSHGHDDADVGADIPPKFDKDFETSSGHTTFRKATISSLRSIGQASVSLAVKNFVHKLHKKRQSEEPETECDLDAQERKEWERERLEEALDFERINIDNAPFQLVDQTSLYKVYSLFSLLGLNRAYVTSLGRLVGLVTLKEIRTALEKSNVISRTAKKITDTVKSKDTPRTLRKTGVIDKEGFIKVALKPMPMKKSSSFTSMPAAIDGLNFGRPATASMRRRDGFSSPMNLKLGAKKSVPEIRIEYAENDSPTEESPTEESPVEESPAEGSTPEESPTEESPTPGLPSNEEDPSTGPQRKTGATTPL